MVVDIIEQTGGLVYLVGLDLRMFLMPVGSMYGIFTYIYHKNQPNVGKYTIYGSYGMFLRFFGGFYTLEDSHFAPENRMVWFR